MKVKVCFFLKCFIFKHYFFTVLFDLMYIYILMSLILLSKFFVAVEINKLYILTCLLKGIFLLNYKMSVIYFSISLVTAL